jgi:hypothetical protein
MDRVCGPRCVQRVLEHYGYEVELIALVSEIQGADLGRGSSMAELARSLEACGVHCHFVRLGTRELPDAPRPVILRRR